MIFNKQEVNKLINQRVIIQEKKDIPEFTSLCIDIESNGTPFMVGIKVAYVSINAQSAKDRVKDIFVANLILTDLLQDTNPNTNKKIELLRKDNPYSIIYITSDMLISYIANLIQRYNITKCIGYEMQNDIWQLIDIANKIQDKSLEKLLNLDFINVKQVAIDYLQAHPYSLKRYKKSFKKISMALENTCKFFLKRKQTHLANKDINDTTELFNKLVSNLSYIVFNNFTNIGYQKKVNSF